MARNTEKPMGKNEQKKQAVTTPKQENAAKAPVQDKSQEKTKVNEENKVQEKKTEEKPKESKKVETKKVKKTETFVSAKDVSVSRKVSISICRFIVGKRIEDAIKDLEEVSRLKKAIPMKGEYAHRKGKMMSGKYPVRASKIFINLLKGLQGNANQHDIDEPIISEAIANKGTAIYASGGRKKKTSHVKIICKEKKLNKKIKKAKGENKK